MQFMKKGDRLDMIFQKWGTQEPSRMRFTMLKNPSPRMKPYAGLAPGPVLPVTVKVVKLTDARIISGVLDRPLTVTQYQVPTPPMALAKVNDGTLYMPERLVSYFRGP